MHTIKCFLPFAGLRRAAYRSGLGLGLLGLSFCAFAQNRTYGGYPSAVQPIHPPVSSQAGIPLQGVVAQPYPQAPSIVAQRPGYPVTFPVQQYPVQQLPLQQHPVQHHPVQPYPVQQLPVQSQVVYYPGMGYVTISQPVDTQPVYVEPPAYYYPGVGYVTVGAYARRGRHHRPPAYYRPIGYQVGHSRYR